ncbi:MULTISPECIES: TIGR04283 family arsenosugar biosynthesis glycosyltransferase [unclassified Afipia]|uniref:TIGR04283 family arsenosugar biosynthesis glycosyltransferase n=1 Tax=unclassified Afipia TaxID=2642050 RepID=UPI00040F6FAD|nr:MULTISPECIES: TIGR04283 family arsenosugar biosynthesis glycosyltransferase [unclassified Afipia]
MLTIIIPVLNEAQEIDAALGALQSLRGSGVEVIVVDGGSADMTLAVASEFCDLAIAAPRGRASQMNAGAALARGRYLLFLHSDTTLPDRACEEIATALGDSGGLWGRFDVKIRSDLAALGIVARLMNSRSRLTGIATGDQAIFVRRDVFERIGGFPDIPLMEDLAISKVLRRLGRPACLSLKVTTSGRRWEKHGVLRTIVLMWRLRLAYFLGADPFDLAVRYGYEPRRN